MPKSAFQLILLIVLGVVAVTAVLMFAGILPGGSQLFKKNSVTVTLWGTKMNDQLSTFLQIFNEANKDTVKIQYIVKDPATYEDDLIEAFTQAGGPDLFFVDEETLYKFENKISVLPYTSYSLRDFKNTFITGADIYTTDQGILGIPIFVDPLVMYINKDIYDNASLAIYPKTWGDFINLPKYLTKLDKDNNIIQSAVAFGSPNNTLNTKAILSMLTIQAGSPIVERNGNSYAVRMSGKNQTDSNPLNTATTYFLQFSDPTKATYSWNRSQPEAEDSFLSGNLASYFGLASELSDLKSKNPHLNFDITTVPQKNTLSNVTFGRIHALVVGKNSSHPTDAWQVALLLSTGDTGDQFIQAYDRVPASRSLLAAGDLDPYRAVFYKAAIGTHSWVDPDSVKSTTIFQNMLDSIALGQVSAGEAYSEASGQLSNLFTNNAGGRRTNQ